MTLKRLMKYQRKKKFYSSLSGDEINDKENQHVFKVWNKFEMKTMKEYHDLCLKYDASLLAHIFEKLIDASKISLCPSHYLSTPALRWHTMLSMI